MNHDKSDADRGLYGKFKIERTDGRSAKGEKHEACRYFVLDLDCDPHAAAALKAYALSCVLTHPALASDLADMVESLKPGSDYQPVDDGGPQCSHDGPCNP